MSLFKKNSLLLILISLSFFVSGQNTIQYTQEQKINLDKKNILTEAPFVPFEKKVVNTPINIGGTFVEIGSGSNYDYAPSCYVSWANFWENVHTQTLYLASEIGGPMLITNLQYSFERISTSHQELLNVEIRFMETPDNELTSGSFYDITESTLVWSSANYVPATATGWANLIDIDDYQYTGDKNIIIDILWGDNGNGNFDSDYHRTYKTDGGVNRMLIGYADTETPPNYDDSSTYYENIRFYGTKIDSVPVSFWVIFASIFLIGISIFMRYRKKLAQSISVR